VPTEGVDTAPCTDATKGAHTFPSSNTSPSSDASPSSYAAAGGYATKSSNVPWVTTPAQTTTPSMGRTGSAVPMRLHAKMEQASSSQAAGTHAMGSAS
jgi:hypothetical protein